MVAWTGERADPEGPDWPGRRARRAPSAHPLPPPGTSAAWAVAAPVPAVRWLMEGTMGDEAKLVRRYLDGDVR